MALGRRLSARGRRSRTRRRVRGGADVGGAAGWFGLLRVRLVRWHGGRAVVAVRASLGVGDADGRALALAGALAGTALSFRLDSAPAVGLSALPLVGAASARGTLAYGAGLGIGLAPLAAHVARIGTERAWRTLFVETVLLAGPGRRLPIPPHGLLAATLVGAAMLAAVALLLLVARMAAAQPMSPRVRGWLALVALSLGALPQLLQRADSLHAIDAACVSLPLCPLPRLGARRPVRAPSPSRARARERCRRCRSSHLRVWPTAFPARAGWSKAAAASRCRPRWLQAWRPRWRGIHCRAAPGDTLFVGPRDLRRTNLRRHLRLLHAAAPATGELLHGDEPGRRQRGGLVAGTRHRTRRLPDPDRPVRRLERAERVLARLGPAAPLRVAEDRFCRLLRSGHFELRERCDRRAE